MKRIFFGSLLYRGSAGRYWSSTISYGSAWYFDFNSDVSTMSSGIFESGFTIRCIKNYGLPGLTFNDRKVIYFQYS